MTSHPDALVHAGSDPCSANERRTGRVPVPCLLAYIAVRPLGRTTGGGMALAKATGPRFSALTLLQILGADAA